MNKVEMSALDYNANLLRSVLLLTLAVSGNFVGNTLGCKTQYYMSNHMLVKHLILIFIIFFTLNYTATEQEHPSRQILRALGIWVAYLMFTKQSIGFTSLAVVLLAGTYILDTYVVYYARSAERKDLTDEQKRNDQQTSQMLDRIKRLGYAGAILTIVVGFLLYFVEKYREYGGDFRPFVFLFGRPVCDSLRT